MDNQHRQIKGYRELSQVEIDLMNKIKALGPQIEEIVREVGQHLTEQMNACHVLCESGDTEAAGKDEAARLSAAEPQRWLAMARTDLQVGLMKLTRAVAQPTFF